MSTPDSHSRWPHIIALYSPRAGMGKSTLAAELHSRLDSERVSFAEPVREQALAILDMIAPNLGLGPMRRLSKAKAFDTMIEACGGKNTPTPYLRGKSLRDLQIGIGEGLRDRFHPDIWIWIAAECVVDAYENEVPFVIIDDLRKPQEFRWLKDYHETSGYVTLVRLVGKVYSPAENHTMEGELESHQADFNLILDNGASVNTLADTILNYINEGLQP